MAKKDKNSLLNIYYSRTLTSNNLSKAANYVGEYVLKGLGTLGRFLNAGFTSPTYGTTGQVSYARNAEDARRLRKLSEASEQAMGKAMTWVSPLNYGTALATGNGLNARKGEEEVASWSPAWQAVGRLGELYVGPKAVKGVKNAPRAVVNTAAKAGIKPAKTAVIAREINKGIKQNTKNGRIEVTEDYFNSPDKWYRVSETPEKFGIREQGKNITTTDSPQTKGTVDRFRRKIIKKHKTEDGQNFILVPGKGINEGYFVRLPVRFSLSKNGAAHGNTSQAAAGQIWQGTFARSGRFPEGIIEGQAPSKIYRGMLPDGTDSRINFILQDWDNVPKGARVGFHTGEMPMSNLGWFLKTNRGTYTYEPIIPEKRISVDVGRKYKLLGSLPRLLDSKTYPLYRGPRFSVNNVVNNNGTINPRLAMTVLHSVADWFGNKAYRMEDRLENSKWHKNDPTTYDHTKLTAQSAWQLPTPFDFTKQDLMIAALGHDFGKMISGEGHAQIGADLARQVFPDLTDALYTAIAEHMGTPTTSLGEVTKAADITNGRPFTYLQYYHPELYNKYVGKHLPLLSVSERAGIPKEPKKNSKITVSDVYKSLAEAEKYKGSKEYVELVHRSQKEAEEMGLPFNSDLYIGVNKHLPNVKLSSRPKGKLGGYRRSTNTIELDPDLLSPTEGKYIPFHEGLHWQKVGTPEMNSPLYNRWKGNMQDDLAWKEFYKSKEYKNLAYEDNAKAYARKKVKEALYEDADPYLSILGELLANGLEAGRAIGLEPFAEYPGYGKALEASKKARDYNRWLYDVKAGTTLEMLNFWKILTGNYLPAVSVPLTTGYILYNINQPLQRLQYLKQGGKMNVLEFLKNGNGIHIKKKNRGKFTSYCGGKVTDECIRKAKASGNPKLVKRATFAANARKWKHLKGGIMKFLESSGSITLRDPVNHEAVMNNLRNRNVAKGLWNGMWSGKIVPSMNNITKMIGAAFNGYLNQEEENNMRSIGEPTILPGMNPTKGVLNTAKAVRTLEDYLKTTKVAAPMLEGSSTARSAYATDRFLGGQMFESSLPEEAMKVQGHGMAKSSTILDALARLRYILDNGFEKGKTFYTAPLKLSEEGKQFGAYLGTAGGTPYFDGHFLITGKPGQMINSVDDIGTIYINDAYENPEALKAAQKIKEYLTKTYPNRAFRLYSEGFK